MEYLKKFETHAQYEQYAGGGGMIKPNVSYCEDVKDVHYNPYVREYDKEYFTTVALENGTISFDIFQTMGTDMITSISYSTDNGKTWTTTDNVDDKEENLVITVNVSNGDKVLWKGNAQQLGFIDMVHEVRVNSSFSSTCPFDANGNVMSLLYGDSFKGKTIIEVDACFLGLFTPMLFGEKTCNIVNAKDLVLPATTLANYCYWGMFGGCTRLTSAPQLLATTLAEFCYASMFAFCTSLTTAPELLATTLARNCYYSMFSDCTSLTTAPQLLATTLAYGCYDNMFAGCTSLTSVPQLLATTLTENCYNFMFNSCISLNYIKCLATDISATNCTNNWVGGVAASGTFVKNANVSWEVGINGIPNGWTVETASE